MQCWGCEAVTYEHCIVRAADEVGLPWYCAACNWALATVRDVTCDVALLKLVVHGMLPEGLYEAARVEHAARFLHWWDGKLYIGPDWAQAIEVPPLWLGNAIVIAYSEALGLPHGSRVYDVLQRVYYWSGMHRDCIRIGLQHDIV